MQSARDALAKSRRDAQAIADKIGVERMRKQLKEAEKELNTRLGRLPIRMEGTFTELQMKGALVQVQAVLRGLTPGMKNSIVDTGVEAADSASGGIVEYLGKMNRQFEGIVSPLALDEGSMIDKARFGAKASILRRILTSGEEVEGAEKKPHLAKLGVLDRYGVNVVEHFESILRNGIVTKMPWEEMKNSITKASPFLQGAPASWAERIVRTEVMGSYNKAGQVATDEAEEQLGDMVKILCATFDDRTGADSIAVHGQIRRTNEYFDTWYGPHIHPPARPNDREIVVPHRISWPIPPHLNPRPRSEVVARWVKQKRKGQPPATPKDTTVARNRFGAEAAPKVERGKQFADE